MMASFNYQDQNAVSGLYCQANFSSCLFIPKREDKFERESILTKCLASKVTPSCKWPIESLNILNRFFASLAITFLMLRMTFFNVIPC